MHVSIRTNDQGIIRDCKCRNQVLRMVVLCVFYYHYYSVIIIKWI